MATDGYGLGLDEFMGYNPDAGRLSNSDSGEEISSDWKKAGRIVFWVATQAPVYPVNRYTFLEEVEWKDKETKQPVQGLRWHKFAGPEELDVYVNKWSRHGGKGGPLVKPPTRDPFLILREWLRVNVQNGSLAPATVVFQWTDFKRNGVAINHTAGELSGLEELVFGRNGDHKLEPDLSYLLTVVDAGNVAAGLRHFWLTKSQGEKWREAIKTEMKSKGQAGGDPRQHPYAFCMEYSPKETNKSLIYRVYPFHNQEEAPFDEEVQRYVYADPQYFPPAYAKVEPQEGDERLIRACMQKAARIDLPLDELFSEDLQVRASLLSGAGFKRATAAPAQRRVVPAQAQPAQRTPPPQPVRRGPPAAPPQRAPSGHPAGAPVSNAGRRGPPPGPPPGPQPGQARAAPPPPAPQSRAGSRGPPPAQSRQPPPAQAGRRVAAPPPRQPEPPPPPPEEELVACVTAGCGMMMHPLAEECSNCHTRYEQVPDDAPAEGAAGGELAGCFACGAEVVTREDGVEACSSAGCGREQGGGGDEIPF